MNASHSKNAGSKMNHQSRQEQIMRSLAITVAVGIAMFAASTHAAVILVGQATSPGSGTVVISDGTTPNGSSVTTAGVNEILGPQVWDVRTTGGTHIADFVLDMRIASLSRQDVRSGGTGFGLYDPAAGTNDYQATGSGGGFLNTLQAILIADMTNTIEQPTNGWVADNPSTPLLEVNWLMMEPDNASQTVNGGIDAVALGFVWTDVGTLNEMDAADTVALHYGVYADTFAEIDTVVELDAAVWVPEPGVASLLAAGGLLVATRRRRRN